MWKPYNLLLVLHNKCLVMMTKQMQLCGHFEKVEIDQCPHVISTSAYIRTHLHTYIHTYTHTYICTYIHKVMLHITNLLHMYITRVA